MQIFEIHRNVERVKLGNMNEKISEITKHMQTETWSFIYQEQTLNLNDPPG